MKTLRFLLITVVASLPLLVLAAPDGTVKYEPLIAIQGVTDATRGGSFSAYVDFLYGLSIAIAALLAVIKIVVAGAKYMMSSLPGTKGDSKSEIQGALLGLLLILGAFLILNTINPALTKTTVNFDPLGANPTKANRPPALRAAAPTGAAAGTTATPQQTALQSLIGTSVHVCVNGKQLPSQTTSATTISLNTSSCNIDQKQVALRAFNELCEQAGGRPDDVKDNNTSTFRCVVTKAIAPAPSATTATSVNCTPGISNPTSSQFTITRYDLSKCSNTVVNPNLDGKTPFIYYRDDFTAVCKQNKGTFTSSSPGIFECKVSK